MTIIFTLSLITIFILYKYSQQNKKIVELNNTIKDLENSLLKYKDIIDLEKEIEKLNEQVKEKKDFLSDIDIIKNTLEKISIEKIEVSQELEYLQREVTIEKELVEDYGFERFAFEFGDSQKYKDAIKEERDYQRQLIRDKKASNIIFPLTFNDSKVQGRKAQNRIIKMMIRTFNGEVDNIIKNVTFRNVETSENKIRKSFESLNSLNNINNGVEISYLYLESKLKELEYNYGKKVKEEEEKELKREEQEKLREQKAAEREIKQELKRQEKERKKKEKEIELKEKILKQITEELGLDNDAAKKAREEIEKLKAELQHVLDRETAISQAELTTAGYVYIISNIGSFGENVFKIGLTRRLQPEQRINELSSASVPFQYNCHGMIWSLNAVELENKLHQIFDKHRLNKVNRRKEFFKVPFYKIKEAVYEIDPNIELIEDVDAEEYYQSLVIEKRLLEQELEEQKDIA